MFNRIGDKSLSSAIKEHRSLLKTWRGETDDEFTFMENMRDEQKALF